MGVVVERGQVPLSSAAETREDTGKGEGRLPLGSGRSSFGSDGLNPRWGHTQGRSGRPALVLQTEEWEAGGSSYVSLTPGDLAALSEVMARLLQHMGIREWDRILVYDFNTSLSTLVMSGFFCPGLREGACEKIKCVAICADGLSELAARSAFVYGRWQPEVLLIRSDLLAPFRSKLPAGRLRRSNPNLRSVVVVHSDAAPWPRSSRAGPGEFSRYLLYRVDPALFMCVIEPCGGIYYPNKAYEVVEERTGSRRLKVAPTFAPGHSSHRSSLECEARRGTCSCGRTHAFRTEELAI